MPGVVSAKVSCWNGSAVVEAKPGTEPTDLVQAVDDIGFASRVRN